jgi:hypothetical protein
MTTCLGHKPNLHHPERLAAILNVNSKHIRRKCRFASPNASAERESFSRFSPRPRLLAPAEVVEHEVNPGAGKIHEACHLATHQD